YERIKRFRLLERELQLEKGEITPTMKVKRSEVARIYAALIDSMYQDPPPAGVGCATTEVATPEPTPIPTPPDPVPRRCSRGVHGVRPRRAPLRRPGRWMGSPETSRPRLSLRVCGGDLRVAHGAPQDVLLLVDGVPNLVQLLAVVGRQSGVALLLQGADLLLD